MRVEEPEVVGTSGLVTKGETTRTCGDEGEVVIRPVYKLRVGLTALSVGTSFGPEA